MPLQPGLTGTAMLVVATADTAQALGSGDMPVLGTPRVVALAEQAACAAVAGHLGEGMTSVGVRIELDHLRPNALADEVVATAELTDVDDRSLSFQIAVTSGGKTVATAVHRRAPVNREGFLGRLGG